MKKKEGVKRGFIKRQLPPLQLPLADGAQEANLQE